MEKAEAHFVECGLEATVKIVGYTVTASITDYMGGGATLDLEGSISVSSGANLAFTVTNPGENLIAVQIDGGDFSYLGYANPTEYTLEDITADTVIHFITTGAG